MANDVARGSQKLLSELIQKGSAATPEEVRAAVSVPAAADLKLLRWLIRGIPPIYYEVETTFESSPAQLPAAINGLLSNAGIHEVHLFPYGIPVIDRAVINAVVAHNGPVVLPQGPGGQVNR